MAGVQILAALGDAPIAAIAVVAILLGVLLAARGPREKRAAGGAEAGAEPGRAPAEVPVAAALDEEPGFVGPEGEPQPQPAAPAPDATIEGPPAVEQSAEQAPPASGKEPAWRVAARAAGSAVRFRAIRTGGKRKNR